VADLAAQPVRAADQFLNVTERLLGRTELVRRPNDQPLPREEQPPQDGLFEDSSLQVLPRADHCGLERDRFPLAVDSEDRIQNLSLFWIGREARHSSQIGDIRA
jgi:hypothetical protein